MASAKAPKIDNKFSSNGSQTISGLAAVLQDMWHYAALINPPSDRRISTFEGDRENAGLIGKCKAYETLLRKIDEWSVECLPAFCEVALADSKEINSIEQMQSEIGKFWLALAQVANDNNIDPYTGNFKHEYILTDGDQEQEHRMLTNDEADELNHRIASEPGNPWWWAKNVNPSGRAGSQWGWHNPK